MPVLPTVAIEVPVEVAPELPLSALRTCNLALGAGRCSLSDSAQPSANARWLAHVGLDPTQPLLLTIELKDAMARATQTTFLRTLSFEDSDAAIHRWSTVGVVVAALVISAETGKDPEPAGNAAPNAAPPDRAPVTTPPQTKALLPKPMAPAGSASNPPHLREGRRVRLDLGGIAGAGIEGDATRLGIAIRPSIELTQSLTLWAQASGSRANDSIEASWWSGAIGLGYLTPIVPGWFVVEARIGVTGSRLAFAASEGSLTDSATRLRYGVDGGLDATLNLGNALGLYVGVDGILATPRVEVRQAGKNVGQSPTTEVLVGAGLRWRIPLGR